MPIVVSDNPYIQDIVDLQNKSNIARKWLLERGAQAFVGMVGKRVGLFEPAVQKASDIALDVLSPRTDLTEQDFLKEGVLNVIPITTHFTKSSGNTGLGPLVNLSRDDFIPKSVHIGYTDARGRLRSVITEVKKYLLDNPKVENVTSHANVPQLKRLGQAFGSIVANLRSGSPLVTIPRANVLSFGAIRSKSKKDRPDISGSFAAFSEMIESLRSEPK